MSKALRKQENGHRELESLHRELEFLNDERVATMNVRCVDVHVGGKGNKKTGGLKDRRFHRNEETVFDCSEKDISITLSLT